MKKKLSFILFVLGTNLSFGQGFEPARKLNYTQPSINLMDSDSLNGTGSEIFQQLGINLTNTVPRVNIKAIKLYAKLGKKTFLDFYILSSIPTLSTNPDDSIKSLGNELQNIYGGLLNSYFSKTWYFNKDKDYQTRGLQLDIKGGYKLNESTKNGGTKNIYLHSGQFSTEIRFLVPLFGSPSDENLSGLAQFKIYGQALYNNNKDYLKFFEDDNQVKPSKVLFSSTIEASIHIFKQFFISGGYSFSSISTIENMGYFKLTYSK
ncbi:MAG: hypothetical protein IPK88_12875 [Saprospiraceae bacterium]|nr:hypothetical protein [Candidatus Defluviibacterium haderslevense]